jgi:hypothetical protein
LGLSTNSLKSKCRYWIATVLRREETNYLFADDLGKMIEIEIEVYVLEIRFDYAVK